MQAPVLTKYQVKKSISKKTPKKKSLRYVLSRPKIYKWPLISEEDAKPLIERLKNLLHYKHDIKIKWHFLKNVPRENRKEVREEKKSKLRGGKKPEALKNFVFGINGIMRGLEKKIITSIMISSDVNPVNMIQPVWYTCVNAKIPVIVVPSLRTVMKNTVGIPCSIVGLLKNASGGLYETIFQLSTQFYPELNQPNEIIELDETMVLVDTIVIDDTMVENTKNDNATSEVKNKKFNDSSSIIKIIDLDDTITIDKEDESNKFETKANTESIYLYRTVNTKRCFVPAKSTNVDSNTLDWDSSFIAFSEDMDISVNISQLETVDECGDSSIGNADTTIIESQNDIKTVNTQATSAKKKKRTRRVKPRITYTPVNIKRLQSNPHRKKRQ